MDEQQLKHVVEAALLAADRPLALDKLLELFTNKGVEADRPMLRRALDELGTDYADRGIELKEVASGYRIQVRSAMQDWLQPLWEERAPRYTRALLETLALIAYRQPITRAEIEEVRGVAVSTNIVRTLMERGWVRVVGYRDVPGKPSMLGTTREFLDYFGLKRLEDLPPLAEIKDGLPEFNLQADFLDSLERGETSIEIPVGEADRVQGEADDTHRHEVVSDPEPAIARREGDDAHRSEEAGEAGAGSTSAEVATSPGPLPRAQTESS